VLMGKERMQRWRVYSYSYSYYCWDNYLRDSNATVFVVVVVVVAAAAAVVVRHHD